MHMSGSDPITVVLPVRNGATTIRSAVLDLLVAMDSIDELLVIDDGSTDDTPAVLLGLQRIDARIGVIRTAGRGLVAALNLGLENARHLWVARADADDRYPAGRLRAQRLLVSDEAVLVSGDYRMMVRGRPISCMPCSLTHPFVVASLIHPQRIPHPGVLLRRDAVLSVGGYLQDDFPAEDLALWCRLATVGEFVGAPVNVLDWTIAPGSITHRLQAQQRAKTENILRYQFPHAALGRLRSSDVERELDAYVGTPLASRRSLLLARDLRALGSFGVEPKARRTVERALFKSPLGTFTAAKDILREKRARDRVRRSLTA